jgi:FkbM family methyltransferase
MKTGIVPTIFLVVLLCISSAGCIEMANPTPDHAKVYGNLIYLDPNYVDPSLIWSLVLNPNGYETELVSMVNTWLNPENPVIEAGAGIGVLSACINERLTHPAEQVSVEPNPYLTESLQKTKNANQMSFTILPKAIAYAGTANVTISVDSSILRNRLMESSIFENTVEVPATTLEQIAHDAGFAGNITLVMNIVGYEHDVLQYEPAFLQNSVGIVIAAVYTDGRNTPDTFASRMERLGFTERQRMADGNGKYTAMVFENTGVPVV